LPARVLHCYADYKWTGPSEPVVRLCRELGDRGWPSDIACKVGPDPEYGGLAVRAREAGVTVFDGFAFRGTVHFISNVGDVLALRRLIVERDYGIVHCHGTWDHIVAYWALKGMRGRIRLVRTDHGAREYVPGYWKRFYYGPNMTDHLIVLSERFAAQAVDRFRRDPRTTSALRGGIDTDTFKPTKAPAGIRGRFGLTDADVVIGVVARIQPHRRFDVLLEAAHIVRERDASVKIVVLGRGTHKQKILDGPIARMGLQRTVLPLGYRTDDYTDILAMLDAGLMLVPGSDGSCRAAMQMAAMAKPLIVGERGVLPDLVRDGQTGIVVGDKPERLAEAMLEMAADAQRRRHWGEAMRERVCRFFSLAQQTEGVEQVYSRVLEGRSP